MLDELLADIRPAVRPAVTAGLRALLMTATEDTPLELDARALDVLIFELDERVRVQIGEILHHRDVQALESAWRGLAFLVDHIRFDAGVRVELLSCTRQELAADFEDAPEIPQSGLYRIVYTSTYGTFGGEPYGLICADFAFGPDAEDLTLLRQCSVVAAIAHAPFIANANAEFFGLDSFVDLPRVVDVAAILAGPRYDLWNAFRETEDARYVGLCLPRFLLRAPYDPVNDPSQPLRFVEEVAENHEHYLWGRASFAFAVRAADSFARYRWCVYLIGSRAGGMVDGLVHLELSLLHGIVRTCPLECLLTSRLEHALNAAGFIGLVYDRASGNAMFHSAASIQRPTNIAKTAADDLDASGELLGTQLPYVFLVCRLAHYLKREQREHIGQWDSLQRLEKELELWLRQFVSDVDEPHWQTRARHFLRKASIELEAVEGQAGWYRCRLRIQPHLTHNSASFTLLLIGRLDREQPGAADLL